MSYEPSGHPSAFRRKDYLDDIKFTLQGFIPTYPGTALLGFVWSAYSDAYTPTLLLTIRVVARLIENRSGGIYIEYYQYTKRSA